jgi:hypothetical protein
VVAHACNSTTQELETGGLSVLGWPELHNKFKINHGYTARPCLKKQKKNKKAVVVTEG